MAHAQTVRSDGPEQARSLRAGPRIGGRGYRVYAPVKVVLEWLASLLLLVFALPLLVVLGLVLVCTSKGPVLYSQIRLGRHGQPFRLYKLRTMAHGCESETGPVWSIAGDPRTTTIGKWLRATHVDELPQLWNVLRGEMSLIGPRPERPEIADQIERALPEFRHRLLVRPGLTGLAQMLRPPDSDLSTVCHKLAHDLEYIHFIGPWVDLRIAVATAFNFAGCSGRLVNVLVGRYAASQPVRAIESAPLLRLTAPMYPMPPMAAPVELSKAA